MTDDEYSLRYVGWRWIDTGRPRRMRGGGSGWMSPRAFMAPVPLASAVRLQEMLEEWDGRNEKPPRD